MYFPLANKSAAHTRFSAATLIIRIFIERVAEGMIGRFVPTAFREVNVKCSFFGIIAWDDVSVVIISLEGIGGGQSIQTKASELEFPMT